ncbi:MAG: HAMP domain-containing histidine kinase, partial [Anaerolineae bacterium]|nr:HAMP domain-containing histidine kinase [Anaerolineae bacterium]
LDEVEEHRSDLEYALLQAQQQVATLQEELKRFTRLAMKPQPDPEESELGETVTALAQELRTPLTGIIGYVDLLLNEAAGDLMPMQSQFLLRVKVNVEHLIQHTEDLLRVMAIDLNQLKLSPRKVDLVDLIDDAITASSAQYREKGLTLHLDVPDAIPLLTADRDALQQVITHLMTNAYLAAPADTVVRISAQHEPTFRENPLAAPQDVTHFSITDFGGGIPPEEQRRVFMRSYRAERPLVQGLGDRGVGLSIAHALVVAHGGKIWFESVPDVSTTFHVVLPFEHDFGEDVLLRGNVARLIDALEEGDTTQFEANPRG